MNLNNYRNVHFTALNTSKKNYKKEVMKAFIGVIQPLQLTSFEINYVLFAPDRKTRDLANVLSVVDKYACDALVELHVLKDDSVDYLKRITFDYGGIDKENPRVEMTVKKL